MFYFKSIHGPGRYDSLGEHVSLSHLHAVAGIGKSGFNMFYSKFIYLV